MSLMQLLFQRQRQSGARWRPIDDGDDAKDNNDDHMQRVMNGRYVIIDRVK